MFSFFHSTPNFQYRVSGTLQMSKGIVVFKNGYLNLLYFTNFLMQTSRSQIYFSLFYWLAIIKVTQNL